MSHSICAKIACLTGMILAGCDGGGLTPNQKIEANKQWNQARASVLESLATDQYQGGSLDKCRLTLDQALHLEPANANLHLLSAKLAFEQDKLEEAEAHLAETRRLDPKNAEADYYSGIVLQRWQQPEKACAAYAEAARKNQGQVCYLLAEGEMMVTLGHAAEALALLQSKAMLFEHSAAIRDEIGQLLLQQQRDGEGIAELSQASILSPEDSTIREHLAFAFYKNRQYTEAVTCFERLLKEEGFEKRGDVNAVLGECQSQCLRFADAQKSFERATQINPSLCGYWLGLSKAALQLNDLPGADIAVRKAISIDPSSSEAQCLRGYVLLKQKHLPESLAAFHSAADLNSADSVNVALQGYVLGRMGRQAEAQLLYARAARMNPHDRLAARLLANSNSIN